MSPNRFSQALIQVGLELPPVAVETLQVNITKLCNQACRHCHVDASPKRREQMDLVTVKQCLKILADYPEITTLDITGGAPELNEHFDYFVIEARKLQKRVIVRHNLTVTFDGHPQTGASKEYLPNFFAEQQVEIVSSLPYYQQYFTDKQRGKGVFEKSIAGLKQLNALGYGIEGSGLILNLVYNPVGAFLPASQADLQSQYRQELGVKYGIGFNNLYTITNMPIHRFAEDLKRLGQFEDYMEKLMTAFNRQAAEGVMCRSLISVGYDGKLYDCDFNQMLELVIGGKQTPLSIFEFEMDWLIKRQILFGDHCFGCTAGAGSSCGGATA